MARTHATRSLLIPARTSSWYLCNKLLAPCDIMWVFRASCFVGRSKERGGGRREQRVVCACVCFKVDFVHNVLSNDGSDCFSLSRSTVLQPPGGW